MSGKRVEFGNLEEAEVWVQDKVYEERKGQYRVYWERIQLRAVFEPKVSTDPITFALVLKVPRETIQEFSKKHPDLTIIPCYRYVWDSRREPGESDIL